LPQCFAHMGSFDIEVLKEESLSGV
jgi:hypothetical protein